MSYGKYSREQLHEQIVPVPENTDFTLVSSLPIVHRFYVSFGTNSPSSRHNNDLKGPSDDVCIANKAYTETCFGHDSVKITSFPVKNGHRFPLYLSFYSYTKHSDIYFPNYKKVR